MRSATSASGGGRVQARAASVGWIGDLGTRPAKRRARVEGGGARARIVPARFPSRSRKARGGRARRHPSLRRRRCSPRNQLATSGDEAAKARFPPAPSHGDLTAGMEPEQLQKSRVRQFSEYCRLLAIRKHAFSSLLAAARRDSPRRGAWPTGEAAASVNFCDFYLARVFMHTTSSFSHGDRRVFRNPRGRADTSRRLSRATKKVRKSERPPPTLQ